MNFQSISAFTAFFQGILSFASPCVLPLLPVYLSYLSGGAENENNSHRRQKLIINSFFFALGIGITFFVLGLGATSLGKFIFRKRAIFLIFGGILVIFFGFLQFGFFSKSFFQKEKRLPFDSSKIKSSPISALLLGFIFSFSWTPCVGPSLASILVMAANSQTKSTGMFLIFCYTLGFALPFVIAGIFASSILNFLKNHKNITKWTAKIGGIILILAGIFMIVSGIVSTKKEKSTIQVSTQNFADFEENSENLEDSNLENSNLEDSKFPPPADFSLFDQNGMQWTLSELKGKIVILNFWATWCPPCKQEMPFFQQVYDDLLDSQNDDVFILGIASPNFYQEKDVPDIIKFLRSNDYSYPCLMDYDGIVSGKYYVSAYPTTYLINREGKTQNVIIGAISKERLEKLVKEAE